MTAVPERDIVYISASSGSTGVPTASPFTAQDFEDFIDCQARLFWRSGMRNTDRYIHALNFSLFIGGPCVLGAQKLGALSIHARVDSLRAADEFCQAVPARVDLDNPLVCLVPWRDGKERQASTRQRTLVSGTFIVSGEPGAGQSRRPGRISSNSGMQTSTSPMAYPISSEPVPDPAPRSPAYILKRIT